MGGSDFEAVDIRDADLSRSSGTGFRDIMLARELLKPVLENGSTLGTDDTGRFLTTRGADICGRGGTGLLSI